MQQESHDLDLLLALSLRLEVIQKKTQLGPGSVSENIPRTGGKKKPVWRCVLAWILQWWRRKSRRWQWSESRCTDDKKSSLKMWESVLFIKHFVLTLFLILWDDTARYFLLLAGVLICVYSTGVFFMPLGFLASYCNLLRACMICFPCSLLFSKSKHGGETKAECREVWIHSQLPSSSPQSSIDPIWLNGSVFPIFPLIFLGSCSLGFFPEACCLSVDLPHRCFTFLSHVLQPLPVYIKREASMINRCLTRLHGISLWKQN